MVTPEMRPARLGLGAKAERKVASSDSVASNLALKKQLTRVNSKMKLTTGPFIKYKTATKYTETT